LQRLSNVKTKLIGRENIMAHKRMKPARPAGSSPGAEHFSIDLNRARSAMDQRRWQEAEAILESLYRRYPARPEPLNLALVVAQETNDTDLYLEVVERLLKISPNDPEIHLALAAATLANGQIALARERLQRFVDRWPKHEEAAAARKTLAELEVQLTQLMDNAGFHQGNRFELAARNDEIQALLSQGRYKEAQSLAQQLLQREEQYAPALNNLTMTYMLQGQLEEAVSTAQRVLEFDPDNVHALANLARSLRFLGRREEAGRVAERMKASRVYAADKVAKMLETLSFLGDDAGVLEVYRQAQNSSEEDALELPLTHHLAGAAAMRLGQEQEAQRYWKEALKLESQFSLTRDNLADLKLPVERRHAPWAYSFRYWIDANASNALNRLAEQFDEADEEEFAQKAVQTLLQGYPYLESLIPLLLERGDPLGRQFALLLAKASQTPALLTALRDFALSQNGPDQMRIEAAQTVSQAGLLDGGMTRLWLRGEWQEILLTGWEIYEEPDESAHSPQVQELAEQAMEFLRKDDGKRGEQRLMQALELEPEAPDLLNNLASAYMLQGRGEEGEILLTQIYEQYPDYFFGKVNMANIMIRDGRLDEAEPILVQLMSEKRLHVTEFAALAQAQVELRLAREQTEAARQWYEMWKQLLPDHPGLLRYRLQFEAQELSKPGLFKRRRKRS
jgi:Flp pilus assembly protein TadD